MRKLLLIFATLVLSFSVAISQAEFDIEEYKIYLDENRNMTYQELLDEYPAGSFDASAKTNFFGSKYASLVSDKLHLTNGEVELLNKNSFVVTERKFYPTYIHALYDVYKNDIPLYVSSDMILHAVHSSFDKILIDYEKEILTYELKQAYQRMLAEVDKYLPTDGSKEYNDMILDAELYLAIGLNLLDPYNQRQINSESQAMYDLLTEAIAKAEGMQDVYLFADQSKRALDFSQFKPRGHYTKEEELKRYFKSMMWLGRTELYINPPVQHDPDYIVTKEDLDRQTRLSFFLTAIAESSDAKQNLLNIDEVLSVLIGRQDNITYFELDKIYNENISSLDELLDVNNVEKLRSKALKLKSATQTYNSQILGSHIDTKEQIEPAAAFMLMGQRPIIDGFITGNLVYDKVLYYDQKVTRMLPNSLDVLFALGNDAAIQALEQDLSAYPYASNLAAVRYLVNAYDSEFWDSSVYTNWLAGIKALNPPPKREARNEMPKFMRTAAWWEKTMNTQLGSWAELRHDFLLYAKQPYSAGVIGCDYPDAWIEPVPELYGYMIKLFENLNSIDVKPEEVKTFINSCVDNLKQLKDIAEKAKNGTMNQQEIDLLKNALCKKNVDVGCGTMDFLDGWYTKLFYKQKFDLGYIQNTMDPSFLVADIHTSPTDEEGNDVGWVKHIATGPVNMCVISTENLNGEQTAFAGPVYSFYEFTTVEYERLTDEEWSENFYSSDKLTYDKLQHSQKSIAKHYLADNKGVAYNGPAQLKTTTLSVEEEPENTSISVYPNPAKQRFSVSFEVQAGENNGTVEVFNTEGNKVFTKSYRFAATGSHILEIDTGSKLSSGVYLIKITSGKRTISSKLIIQ